MKPCVSDKKALLLLVATNVLYFSAYVVGLYPLSVLVNIAIFAICLGGMFQLITGRALSGGSDEEGREFVTSDCIAGVLEVLYKRINGIIGEGFSLVRWKSPASSVTALVLLYIFGLFARVLSFSALFFFSVWTLCGWMCFEEQFYSAVYPHVTLAYSHVREVVLDLHSKIPRFKESQKL
ncbi:reticulon domain-containing protein [Babesia caballi]|uniref:Reticulon domain-containing protein n=1 Tax=Babesia caballi TaxID=5871 RepID=A0AAV4LX36_BABCB|nr:reticulon domain-containing protein [Babesia caballi]